MTFAKRMVLFVLVAVVMLAAIAVSAHEGREVGDYVLEFGWRSEPALVGYSDGPEIFISLHDAHEADHADDAAAEEGEHDESEEEGISADVPVDLQVEVTFGPATKTLSLEPAYGENGHYVADLIPTRPGDYTFRIFGTIGDTPVDETFTSSAGEFSSAAPASDVTFPDSLPSMVELLDRLAALEARIAALEAK